MLQHYLLIAIRNLLKYKTQSIISIIGLAIGFSCFALATLWIRYEMSYDDFHDGAERIFLVRNENDTDNDGLSRVTPYPLAAYLQETFPEIEQACNMCSYPAEFNYKDVTYPAFLNGVDSATLNMFPVKVISGNTNFLIPDSKEIAITEEIANRLFGTKSPLGEKFIVGGEESTICAVVKSWGKHSNMPFDLLTANNRSTNWGGSSWDTFIKLRKGIDPNAYMKKIYTHATGDERSKMTHFVLTPITKLRYDHPINDITIKFNHILLFALTGGLVILCSLFNYLTLFVSRIRMRSKEIALRKVCGSSNKHLMSLFSIEYLLTLLMAIFIGTLLMELVLPTFKEMAEIHLTNSHIYLEAFAYSGIVALFSFVFSLFPIYYFRKQSLDRAIKGTEKGNGKSYFQKVFIIFQFIISIGFIFCTIVMIKQIHYLLQADQVVECRGRGSLLFYPGIESLKEGLKTIPQITDIQPYRNEALIPSSGQFYTSICDWDDKAASAADVTAQLIPSGETFCNYYNIQLIKGKMLKDNAPNNEVMINETAARSFGWKDPVGKTILRNDSMRMTVVGVVRDFCKTAPTVPIKPVLLAKAMVNRQFFGGGIHLFSFEPEQWKACKQRIELLIKEKYPEIKYYRLCNAKEEFETYLQSEKALIRLLNVVSVICIIISIFGIFSLVTLNCEQRQKEIAIRKVNGATTYIILRMFFREYLLLLLLASAIAFPAAYLIMKRWIENYIFQTPISLWIYLMVFFSIGTLITGCISWRIWKAANRNPAEMVKSE